MMLNVCDVVAFLFCEKNFETLFLKSFFSVGLERMKLISEDKIALKMVREQMIGFPIK